MRRGWKILLLSMMAGICLLAGCAPAAFSGFEHPVYFLCPDAASMPGSAVWRVEADGEEAWRLPLHTGVDDCLQAGETLYFVTHDDDTDISPIPYMLTELHRYRDGQETLLAESVVGTIQLDGGQLYYLQYRGGADTLRLCRYDPATGGQHPLFEAPVLSFLIDGGRIYTVERAETGDVLWLHDPDSGEGRPLVQGEGMLRLEAALPGGPVYMDGNTRWYHPLETGEAVTLPYEGLLLPGEGTEGYLLTPDGWIERVPLDHPGEGERLIRAEQYTGEGESISRFYRLSGWIGFSTDSGPTYRYNPATGAIEQCPDVVRGLPAGRE